MAHDGVGEGDTGRMTHGDAIKHLVEISEGLAERLVRLEGKSVPPARTEDIARALGGEIGRIEKQIRAELGARLDALEKRISDLIERLGG